MGTELNDWRSMSNTDALKAWEAGEKVTVCSMAERNEELTGFDSVIDALATAKYEQIVQAVGFAMFRIMEEKKPDWNEFDESEEAWVAFYRANILTDAEILALCDTGYVDAEIMTSAVHIAAMFYCNGYSEALTRAPEARLIQVVKPVLKTEPDVQV